MKHDDITSTIANWLHSLTCRVCNPFSLRRRRAYADNAQAGGDMAYFRNLIRLDESEQAARLDALREELGRSGAAPWEADLLVKLVDEYRKGRRNLVLHVPPMQGDLR